MNRLISSSGELRRIKQEGIKPEQLVKAGYFFYCQTCGKKIANVDKLLWTYWIEQISQFKFSSLYKLTICELHSLYESLIQIKSKEVKK